MLITGGTFLTPGFVRYTGGAAPVMTAIGVNEHRSISISGWLIVETISQNWGIVPWKTSHSILLRSLSNITFLPPSFIGRGESAHALDKNTYWSNLPLLTVVGEEPFHYVPVV